MKLLELFSGTGSVGKVAKSKGFEVVSLDLKNAIFYCDDILQWNNKEYPSGYFVWCFVGYFDFMFRGCKCKQQRAQAEAFFFLTKKGHGLPSCASATSLCNLEAKNQRNLRG